MMYQFLYSSYWPTVIETLFKAILKRLVLSNVRPCKVKCDGRREKKTGLRVNSLVEVQIYLHKF